ncbi:hypothetical protein CTEN210_14149 [Chaetoceros tenuissimus]|uniref:Kinesin light chain n=2 Tax=Chaetoceros tenuissimus TaxID=426638 RepID=A0AAD3D4K5_9STRA|nr:hypothetical protein CTEN210_14149 [Chaetoceros tenuissimus]
MHSTGQYEEAIASSNQALEDIRRLQQQELVAESESMNIYRHSSPVGAISPPSPLVYEYFNSLHQSSESKHSYEEGMHTFTKAIPLCQASVFTPTRISLSFQEVTILLNQGMILSALHHEDKSQALACYEKALQLLPAAVDGTTLNQHVFLYAAAIHRIGSIHFTNGKLEQAAQVFHDFLRYLDMIAPSSQQQSSDVIAFVLSSTLNCFAVCKLHAPPSSTQHETLSDALKKLELAQNILSTNAKLQANRSGGISLSSIFSLKATMLNNFGRVLFRLQKLHEALEYFNKALIIRQELFLDCDHIDVAATFCNIGDVHSKLGNNDAAISAYKSFILIAPRTLGEHHTDVTSIILNVADLYYEAGDWAHALHFYKSLTNVPDFEPRYLRSVFNRLGLIYHRREEYCDAIKMFHSQLCLDQELGMDPSTSVITLCNIGAVLRDDGFFDESIKFLSSALELLTVSDIDQRTMIDVIDIKTKIALTYKMKEDYESAEATLLELLDFCDHQDRQKQSLLMQKTAASTLNLLAMVHFENKNYSKASTYFQKSLKVYMQLKADLAESPSIDLQIANVITNISTLMNKKGHTSKGLDLLKQSLQILYSAKNAMSSELDDDISAEEAELSSQIASFIFSNLVEMAWILNEQDSNEHSYEAAKKAWDFFHEHETEMSNEDRDTLYNLVREVSSHQTISVADLSDTSYVRCAPAA